MSVRDLDLVAQVNKVPLGTPELHVEHRVELRLFSIQNLRPRVTFWDLGKGFCRMCLVADMRTPDRDDPYKAIRVDFHSAVTCHVGEARDPSFVATQLRKFVLDVLLHELDERLMVNGVRAYDPHARKGG